MITEAEQREAYEFIRPELKGNYSWVISVMEDGRIYAMSGEAAIYLLPPLYTNGKPDLNTVFEFVKKLINEGIRVEFNCEDQCTFCRFWKRHEVVAGKMSTDGDPVGELFYAAFIQWREAQ